MNYKTPCLNHLRLEILSYAISIFCHRIRYTIVSNKWVRKCQNLPTVRRVCECLNISSHPSIEYCFTKCYSWISKPHPFKNSTANALLLWVLGPFPGCEESCCQLKPGLIW